MLDIAESQLCEVVRGIARSRSLGREKDGWSKHTVGETLLSLLELGEELEIARDGGGHCS